MEAFAGSRIRADKVKGGFHVHAMAEWYVEALQQSTRVASYLPAAQARASAQAERDTIAVCSAHECAKLPELTAIPGLPDSAVQLASLLYPDPESPLDTTMVSPRAATAGRIQAG